MSVHEPESGASHDPCPVHGALCPYEEELMDLREEVQALSTQVRTDELTGLYNYRHFLHSIDLEMERGRRSGHPVSLIILDLDHFKEFNDHYGHEFGNLALQHVARIVLTTLRRLDIPCRYGGEEFAIILPNTPLHAAISLAERLRLSIEQTPLVVADEPVRITASFGVDWLRPYEKGDLTQFVARADAWLYKAKEAGRNTVRHPEDVSETHVSKEERDFLLGDF